MRKPIYSDKQKGFRLCSMPNGLWQLQALKEKPTKWSGGWEPMARSTDLATAKQQLEARVA